MANFKELLAKETNVVEIAKMVGIDIVKPGTVFSVAVCPFHADHADNGGKPNLNLFVKTNTFKCFKCGAQGDLIALYMQAKKLDFKHAMEQLSDKFGIRSENYIPRKTKQTIKDRPKPGWTLEGIEKAHDFLLKSPDILKAFQDKRNLPLEYIKKKKIGYYVQHTAFTVPVFDAKGELVNIRFHKITGSQKWGLRHKPVKVLYDITSFKKDAEEVWVCEGEGDFWVLEGLMGLNAITSIGGALTIPDVVQENIALFKDKKVILALDNDEVGVMATAKLRLALGTDNVFRVDWPENFPTKGDVRDFITGA